VDPFFIFGKKRDTIRYIKLQEIQSQGCTTNGSTLNGILQSGQQAVSEMHQLDKQGSSTMNITKE
jgi:hypothetical protein